MKWTKITDALPEIPKDRYGVYVLVCEYDCCYDETDNDPPTSSGCALTVRSKLFGTIRNREGDVQSTFDEKFGENQFMELLEGYAEDTDWVPSIEQITHWMYFPDPPKYDAKWNEEKDRLEFIYV